METVLFKDEDFMNLNILKYVVVNNFSIVANFYNVQNSPSLWNAYHILYDQYVLP